MGKPPEMLSLSRMHREKLGWWVSSIKDSAKRAQKSRDDGYPYDYSWEEKGHMCVAKGEYEAAISCYEKYIEHYKQIGTYHLLMLVWFYCGVAAEMLGDYEKAIFCYEKELEDTGIDIWYELGMVYSMVGKHNQAIKCYKESIENAEKQGYNRSIPNLVLEGVNNAKTAIRLSLGVIGDRQTKGEPYPDIIAGQKELLQGQKEILIEQKIGHFLTVLSDEDYRIRNERDFKKLIEKICRNVLKTNFPSGDIPKMVAALKLKLSIAELFKASRKERLVKIIKDITMKILGSTLVEAFLGLID